MTEVPREVSREEAYDWVTKVDEDDALLAAEKAVGNWKQFESFAWSGQPEEDSENWTIVYTNNRDSGLLDQSNATYIEGVMSQFPEDEVRAERHSHWAVGWVDGYSIRVYNPDGSLTDAFKAWVALSEAMADYPILDESHYSELEHEAALDGIEDVGRNMVKDGVPEYWPGEVMDWLYENSPDEVENTDDRGAYPSKESVKAALDALGYLERDEDEFEDEEEPGLPPVDPGKMKLPGVESKMKNGVEFDKSGRVQAGLKDDCVARIASAIQKKSQEGTYQGWKNYETWAVALYINNDRGEYEYWQERIETLKSEGGSPSEVLTPEESVKYGLSDDLKAYFEEWKDEVADVPSPFSELLNGGFSEVYWDEIAEDLLSE